MKKLTTVLIAISLSLLTFAQPWSVNPAEYEFSMNIIGEVSISGEITDNASNYIGAFIDDICVGVCSPIEVNEEFNLFYLTVYSSQSSGGNVEFKFVDESEYETLISNTIAFSSDAIVGNSGNPFLWMDTEIYASTDFISFSLTEEFSSAVINTTNKTINIVVVSDSDLTSLIPTFELAPAAIAEVDNIEQESTVTNNDYSGAVEYVVEGIDGTSSFWTINVSLDVSAIEQPTSEIISVYPNPTSDYLHLGISDLEAEKILICDVNGKSIIEDSMIDSMSRIDVSGLNAGVYFISVFSDKGIFKIQFVKK